MLTGSTFLFVAVSVLIALAMWWLARKLLNFIGTRALAYYAKRKNLCRFCYVKPRAWIITGLKQFPEGSQICEACMEEQGIGDGSPVRERWCAKGNLLRVDTELEANLR